MQNHNDDTIKTSNTVFRKICTSHFIWKGHVWEGVGDRTELQHIDPHSISDNRVLSHSPELLSRGPGGPASLGHVLVQHLLSNWSGLQTGLISKTVTAQSLAWGPTLLGSDFLYHIFSPTRLVSKLTDFLSSLSYIIVQHTPSWRHKFHSFNPFTFKVIIS